MDTKLFTGWLIDYFLEHAVCARPLLVVVLSSHYQLDLIRFAQESMTFCLLPLHTTMRTSSIFKPLKQNWQDTVTCHEHVQTHPDNVVTKYQFSEQLHKV